MNNTTLTQHTKSRSRLVRSPLSMITIAILSGALLGHPAYAQQAGGIKGKIVSPTKQELAGVTVTASSKVMPKPRTVTTNADGSYNMPLLIPGKYQLTIRDASGQVRQMDVEVLLDQTASVDVVMDGSGAGNIEVIKVSGSSIVRDGNSALTNSLGQEALQNLPIGQDYRDILKLVPGVQYSENSVLGPAAGGSGADNKYGFDGVDVSLPLFGNLAADPSTHDIASVSMDRGGAKAVGFNRSGGFSVNTISKSGTNDFAGHLEYKIQDNGMASEGKGLQPYDDDKSWLTASVSGPLIQDTLFFYGSYYRPEVERANKETSYGSVKNYKSVRDEYFGKLTWAPTDDLLFNASLRTSDREGNGASIGINDADSVSLGEQSLQDIYTLEGSYILNNTTSLSFNASRFELDTASVPDNKLNFTPVIGSTLNISNLDKLGSFRVPTLIANPTTAAQLAFNATATQLINQFGYNKDGVKTGGGRVGSAPQISNQNFSRDNIELALNHEFELAEMQHSLHLGVKYSSFEEELSRLSNGWGSVEYIGGLNVTAGTKVPYFFQTSTEQMSLQDESGRAVVPINSAGKSYNLEINDTIVHGDFDYNVGVLISQDMLYGQGLKPKAGTVSGFEVAQGHKYKMLTVDWQDMIQPRLGTTWRYDGENTIFANYASYNPEASSLARAASWDRSTQRTLLVRFDEQGKFLEVANRGSSSGKVFAENLKPRRIDEFTLGTTKAIGREWYFRSHVRHRAGAHFWEDIWNYARTLEGTYGPNGGVPMDLRALGDYVPNLADIRKEIGGSSYVIAEVDGGYTKYWEASFEVEWIGDRTYLNASYVWSRYTGNFDQDNTTYTNDANTFIGSSYYNDDKGKYVWDNKDGRLSADKPHLLKVYGYYTTDWQANIGAYLLYQSGPAWETWSGAYYGLNPKSNYDAVSAYAEPAGSRRGSSHWQLDLNYTQSFALSEDLNLKFRADLFNVFDRQTGYDIEPIDFSVNYGKARKNYSPRRVQLSVRVDF